MDKFKGANSNIFSKPLKNTDLEAYLRSIKFDDRSKKGTLSDKELKRILLINLKKYFRGEVAQDFIVSLASAIYEECPEEDDTLWTVICQLTEIGLPGFEKSATQVDRIFRSALEILKKDLHVAARASKKVAKTE